MSKEPTVLEPIDIKALRSLLAAGTPGPWKAQGVVVRDQAGTVACTQKRFDPNAAKLPVEAIADAALIVAAVNNLDPLLDQLEAVTKERDEARERLPDPESAAGAFNDALARTLGKTRIEREILRADLAASRAREAKARKVLERIYDALRPYAMDILAVLAGEPSALDEAGKVTPVGNCHYCDLGRWGHRQGCPGKTEAGKEDGR